MITIRFDSKFRMIAQLFDSIQNEKKEHYSHGTSLCSLLQRADDGPRLHEWMNTYIYIAPVKQKSSEALAAE